MEANMQRLREMYYDNGGDWHPLPAWSQFYLQLGAALSNLETEGRFVAILAVPARDYAACLIASAIVLTRAVLNNDYIPKDHVERLKALKPGWPLLYRTGKRMKKGYFERVKSGRDVYFIIKFDHQPDCDLIPESNASQIEILKQGSVSSLPQNRQKGRGILSPPDLLCALLNEQQVKDMLIKSREDCILVGVSRTLKEEATNLKVALKERKGQTVEGNLQDILRSKRLLKGGDVYLPAYRSKIITVSTSPKGMMTFAGRSEPYTVVFDGAASYLKWRDFWSGSNWIVILDRTSRQFEEACGQANSDAAWRAGDITQLAIPPLPPGVEMMLYEV